MLSALTYADIEGVLLAGGKNSRFHGAMKVALPVDDKPMMHHTAEIFDSLFAGTLIVTNTPELLAGSFPGYRMVPDIYRGIGPLGGIHAAMSNSSMRAIFVAAGDMPSVSREIVANIADHAIKTGADVVVPLSSGRIEPLLALYSTSLREELEQFLDRSGKFAIRDFLEQVNVEYLETAENLAGSFTNINTPGEYKSYTGEGEN